MRVLLLLLLGALTACDRGATERASSTAKTEPAAQAAASAEPTQVAHGADPGSDSGAAMLAAAAAGEVDTLRPLLQAGADPNTRSEQQATPLLLAASRGQTEAVAVLLAGGAAHDVVDPSTGMTALSLAAFQGHADVVRQLLTAGANADAADSAGLVARDYARSQGHAAVLAMLPPLWVPKDWQWHAPFDDQSPYWPELVVFTRRPAPSTQTTVLLRSPDALETQVFLRIGSKSSWQPLFDAQRQQMRGDPLLQRRDSAVIAMADGHSITVESFAFGRGRIGGRALRQALGMASIGEDALIVEAGSAAQVDLLAALQQILSRLDRADLAP